MKTALVIMAAGMGSRFGGGIKQLEPVGPNGEIIMDIDKVYNLFFSPTDTTKFVLQFLSEQISPNYKNINLRNTVLLKVYLL